MKRRQQRDLLGEVRHGRERDRPAHLQLRRPLGRQRRRPQRGLAALRVARDDDPAAEVLVELARRAHHVEHRVALGAPDQVRMLARRAEALVVRAHDRVAGLQPALQQRVGVVDQRVRRVGGAVARGRAGIRDPGRPVAPGDDRPAALGRLALRDRHRAGHGDRLAVHARRAVEHEPVARPALQRRGAGQLARPDQPAVALAGERRGRLVEGGAARALADLGGVGGGGKRREEQQTEDERESGHAARP